MEDELTDDSPSKSYTEVFNEAFPEYLALGMSYQDFWERDVCLVKYYRKACRIQQNQMLYNCWLQGAFVYEAIYRVAPALNSLKPREPHPYVDPPELPDPDEKVKDVPVKEEEQMNKAIDFMTALAMGVNKKRLKEGENNAGHAN